MLDCIIRGGTIYDGSGRAPRTADLGISNGLIADIGRISTSAHRVIDADGAIVTPGFIDVHSHYDAQFILDDRLDPSFSHGVTTVVGGNCGVGFAPVDGYRRELIELMEGVEDIPGVVLDEGLDWNWRSFPDFLDRMAERSYSMDVAQLIPHAPLRVFVMGERALRHEAATPDDIAAMAALIRESMAAGAMGFSNGRLVTHESSTGAKVPGTYAEDAELLALASAMGEHGRGFFQLIPRGTNGAFVVGPLSREERMAEHHRIEAIARAAARPVTYTLFEFAADIGDLPMMVEASRNAARSGLSIRPQMSARGLTSIHMLDTYHVFIRKPSYRAIAHLPLAQRAAAMREPARRDAILAEDHVDGDFASNPALIAMLRGQPGRLPNTYILANALDYEPGADRKVGSLAQAAGKSPEEFIYDHYAQGDGSNYSVTFSLNYASGNLDHVREMFMDPQVISGRADGGAHSRIICDASMPTFQLAFWTRERTRGERLSVEHIVKKMTSEPASLCGFDDRGLIALGKRADLNVVDYDRLTLKAPFFACDLPSGAGRLHQASEGYVATLVNGEVTRECDQDTRARPGRLVRSNR